MLKRINNSGTPARKGNANDKFGFDGGCLNFLYVYA